MKTYEKKLINSFKSFVQEETNLVIDFRRHVFLKKENAETIVGCLFDFLNKYHVEFVELLMSQTLKSFLLEQITTEIDEDIFNAVNSEDTTTEILSICLADFDDEQTTVEIKVYDAAHQEHIFYVQTTDGKHRGDLGCWITTEESSGDISKDNFPFVNFGIVVDESEKYIRSLYEIKQMDNIEYDLKVYADKTEVCKRNFDFINAITSSYQTRHKVIEVFYDDDHEQQATEYVNNVLCI